MNDTASIQSGQPALPTPGRTRRRRQWLVLLAILSSLALAACGSASAPPAVAGGGDLAPLVLSLPAPAVLDGRPLRVVATTSIIGDVVGRVGGDAITLTTLMGPGQDPHSYQPAAADLTAVAEADVVFVNGWDLEQNLAADLPVIAGKAAVVPVSAGIAPLALGDHDADHEDTGPNHDHGTADPHTWLDVANVAQWTANIAATLAALDPANAALYNSNAAGYAAELTALDAALRTELTAIPEDRRVLVTNHDALGYFARAYGFRVLGTIIPGTSTLAEPSANSLAALVTTMEQANVCALFTETTANDKLGQTVAAELGTCDTVRVLPLYTGALGRSGSSAETYTGMMQANVDMIVTGLR